MTGAFKRFYATMASAGTLTGAVDLKRGYTTVYLEIPSMTSNTQHYLQVANEATGTYRRVTHPMINSSTLGTNDWAVASSITNRVIPVPSGFQFVKVESEVTVGNGASYVFLCADM